MNTTLLLVDVQNDFHPGGSLAIPSADKDAERIASFISNNRDAISRIVATLDTHHELHIANSGFWVDESGTHPSPFTLISAEDIETGKWKPITGLLAKSIYDETEGGVDPKILDKEGIFDSEGELILTKYCAEYAKQLESTGKFQLCIWPDHCIIGTPGHNVVTCVQKELTKWVKTAEKSVEWVHKGQNLLTEMYSVFKAEVPVTESTSYNKRLLEGLLGTDRLFIAGQALSHCVNFTVRDIVSNWPKEELHKIYILTDCCSSVPGCEESGKTFLDDMKDAGLTLCTSEDAFK